MPNTSNNYSNISSPKNFIKTSKRVSTSFIQNLIYFIGIIFILIMFICQCSAHPLILANNDDIDIFKFGPIKKEQFEHQMVRK